MKLCSSFLTVMLLVAFCPGGPRSLSPGGNFSQEASTVQQSAKSPGNQETEGQSSASAGDLNTAINQFNLGRAALERWDLIKAEEYFRNALAIQEKLAPGSLAVARSLNGLGAVAEREGYSRKAENNYLHSLAISKVLDPNGMDAAVSLHGLGNVALSRLDTDQGEKYLTEAFAIIKKFEPDGIEMAVLLNDLAEVKWRRDEVGEAEKLLRQALTIERRLAPESLERAASLTGLGLLAFSSGKEKSKTYFGEALDLREKRVPDSLIVANSLWLLGVCEDDPAKSDEFYQKARIIQDHLAPESLALAWTWGLLSQSALKQGNFPAAEQYRRQELAIYQKLEPDSLLTAKALEGLSDLFAKLGDLQRAEEQALLAVKIRERLGPGTERLAWSLSSLGDLASSRGDLDAAQDYHQRALTIRQEIGSERQIAISLRSLGQVAQARGDLLKAERYHRQVLEIRQRLAPGTLEEANSLFDLGRISQDRSDLDKAEGYYQRALIIWEKVVPGSLYVARGLRSLGELHSARGDRALAESYYRSALAIWEKIVPGSTYVAWGLSSLGQVIREGGDPVRGEELQRQALAIQEKLAPGTRLVASILVELGNSLADRGELSKAEGCYRQALNILEKYGQGTTAHAEVLASLARAMRLQNRPEEAALFYERALNALEDQTSRLGGRDELRSGFRASHAAYYKDFIELLVAQNHPELAFQVLERFRARTLLETLTTAHVDVRLNVDPSLAARASSFQQLLAAKSEQRAGLLSGKHSDAQLAVLSEETAELLSKYKDLEDQLRASNPNYRELTQPPALSVQDVQHDLLDSNTTLLEYSLGTERSYVFALTQTTVKGFELANRSEIESEVRLVYNLLTARNQYVKGETVVQRELRLSRLAGEFDHEAAKLAKLVLEPVDEPIRGNGRRLLIVSDGALQYIPFAALPVPQGNGVPLVAEHEIVNLPSASVLRALRQAASGRKPPPKALAVFADPVFAQDDIRVRRSGLPVRNSKEEVSQAASVPLDHLSRSVADVSAGGRSLPRLRFSRREAEAITAITRGEVSKVLDFKANRATAISPELAQYRIVHFATHGLLDSEHPEFSGLVLSLVDENGRPENGFLELQDIYNLHLPVDLVVLSACETGLGKEISGEGIVGLTRGFMYAGVTRVVASLWKVSDVVTAELMEQFYRAMEVDHKPPAAALRAAQVQMWKRKNHCSPYYWAAFQLQGEWR